MAFWNRKQLITIPAPKPEELIPMMELLSARGLQDTINNQIEKMIDSTSQFQAYENADDQGNYFGSEFNIRATAGRIKSTYSREPWVFTTATLIAKTLSTVPMIVVDKEGKPMPGHPLQAKINLSNRLQDKLTLEWCGILDLVLCGNFIRIFNETFTEMMQVPAEQVQIILSPDGKSIESVKIVDITNKNKFTVVPYKQVMMHKFPNPWNPYYGMSLFTACSRPIIMDRFKNEFEMAFYLRGATNSGVIETTDDINKSRMERLMRTFEQVYTGKRNWWRTIFLPKGAKWVQSGLTMTEMQHLEGLRENRLTILAALGIPPSKVGLVQDVNRSTSDNQDKDFWMNTIKPLAEFLAAGWNNSFLVKTIYGNQGIKVIPDFSHVDCLQTSVAQKGTSAKTVEPYMTINEIRTNVLGIDPLPLSDPRGNLFVSEIKGSQPSVDPLATILNNSVPVENAVQEPAQLNFNYADVKAATVANQEQIESKLSTRYIAGYSEYMNAFLKISEDAIRNNQDVEKRINANQKKLGMIYIKEVEQSLQRGLDRGFAFANSQVKSLGSLGQVTKAPKFTAKDSQAIEALRAEQADGQRKTLVTRALESFVGFNKTRTKEVLNILAKGVEDGQSLDTIAATLRTTYGEAYKDQAFTVARTEVLTAISQGMKWNHDVLGKVFTKTKKRWFHVGDVGSNPDAREQHAEFDALGEVDSDYKYGSVLEYPRDPNGSASDNINCRCSMVTVIPDDAASNADIILDSL